MNNSTPNFGRRPAFYGMRKMCYVKNGQIFSVNVWEEISFFLIFGFGGFFVCFIHSVLFLYWVFFSKETLASETSHDGFSCTFLAVQDQIW